jgi:molybdopterin converting factor small subunit
MITVRFIGPLRLIVGKFEVSYNISSRMNLNGLVEYLIIEHGLQFKNEILQTYNGNLFYEFIVNGHSIDNLQWEEFFIDDGDSILITYPVSGG